MEERYNTLTVWLRRHPLTVLLVVATVCVDAVALVIQAETERAGLLLRALITSQLSLLAWWVTVPGDYRLLRWGGLLMAVAYGGALVDSEPQYDPLFTGNFTVYQWQADMPALAIHAAAVVGLSWLWRRLLSPTRHIEAPSRIQFSMFQLLQGMTGCAVLAAMIGYSSPAFPNEISLVILLNGIALGVAAPGMIYGRWPLPNSIAGPLLAWLACTWVVVEFGVPMWITIANLIATLVYIIWGAHVWGSAKESPSEPRTDHPPLAA